MRQFNRMIFFGMGVQSAFEGQGLVDRVKYGLSVLSGLQQDGTNEELEKEKQNLLDIVSDVAMAFGCTIEFVGDIEFNGAGSNMENLSPTNQYRIQVLEKNKWRNVDFKDFGEQIGLDYNSYEIASNSYLTREQADAALNFLTHGHTAFLGRPDAPCHKFGKTLFYAIFPRG